MTLHIGMFNDGPKPGKGIKKSSSQDDLILAKIQKASGFIGLEHIATPKRIIERPSQFIVGPSTQKSMYWVAADHMEGILKSMESNHYVTMDEFPILKSDISGMMDEVDLPMPHMKTIKSHINSSTGLNDLKYRLAALAKSLRNTKDDRVNINA